MANPGNQAMRYTKSQTIIWGAISITPQYFWYKVTSGTWTGWNIRPGKKIIFYIHDMGSAYRNFCFTSFNTEIAWFETDWTQKERSIVQYIIVQGEYCKDQKKHIQGYCQLNTRVRMSTIKEFFRDSTMHIEKRFGTHEQARDYCKQEKNGRWHEFVEFGDAKEQGKRTDLLDLRDRIKQGERLRVIINESTNEKELSALLKYNRTFKEYENDIKTAHARETLLKAYKDVKWKDWQQSIIDIIKDPPHPRTIIWYYDPVGNSGKSYISKYLQLTTEVYYITGGKQADILYAYEDQGIIIYDLARTYADNMDHIYTTMENFKNGMYLSTKYESRQRVFAIPHIFVMANYEPHTEKLSQDRWDIRTV